MLVTCLVTHSSCYTPPYSSSSSEPPGICGEQQERYCPLGKFFSYSQCGCVCSRYQFCPLPQIFNKNTCLCECPTTSSGGECQSPLMFNPRSCKCECPFKHLKCLPRKIFSESLCKCVCNPSITCKKSSQVLDPESCQCICKKGPGDCSSLQKFNPQTCSCDCFEVIPAVDLFSDDEGEDEDGDLLGSGHDSGRQEVGSGVMGSGSGQGSGMASACPKGQSLDSNTCKCFF